MRNKKIEEEPINYALVIGETDASIYQASKFSAWVSDAIFNWLGLAANAEHNGEAGQLEIAFDSLLKFINGLNSNMCTKQDLINEFFRRL